MRSKIKIYKETYQDFYTALLKSFSKHIPDKTIKMYGEGNYRLWFYEDPLTRYQIFPTLFNNKPYGVKFWLNRLSTYDKLPAGGYNEENPLFMISAFNLIGLELPHNFKDEANQVKKAEILYQLFLEKYKPEYLKLNPDKRIHSTEIATIASTNSSFDDNFENSELREKSYIEVEKDNVISLRHIKKNVKNNGVPDSDIEQLKVLVESFMTPEIEVWKWYETWQYFSKPLKSDFRRDKYYYYLAVRHIRKFENPFLFGFVNTVSNRSDFEEHTFEKHITFKVFFSIKARPMYENDYFEYQAYLDSRLSNDDLIKFLKKWVLIFYKSIGSYKRNKVKGASEMLYDEYFADFPRLLDIYNKENDLIYALRQDFDKMDGFRMLFRAGELTPEIFESEVTYDKIEWWDCVYSNGKWYIDNIKPYPINEPYLKVLFGRPQIIDTL